MYKSKQCLQCGQITKNPKFCCRSCAGIYNNKLFPKRKRTYSVNQSCKLCGRMFNKKYCTHIFCSIKCSRAHTKQTYIKHIETNGTFLPCNKTSLSGSRSVRNYLIQKHGNQCMLCHLDANNWHGKPITLIVDHIDGHSNNWDVDNIQLVCPNCDSQLPTFKARNKGNCTRTYTITQKNIS